MCKAPEDVIILKGTFARKSVSKKWWHKTSLEKFSLSVASIQFLKNLKNRSSCFDQSAFKRSCQSPSAFYTALTADSCVWTCASANKVGVCGFQTQLLEKPGLRALWWEGRSHGWRGHWHRRRRDYLVTNRSCSHRVRQLDRISASQTNFVLVWQRWRRKFLTRSLLKNSKSLTGYLRFILCMCSYLNSKTG